jgi:hypothetical protein
MEVLATWEAGLAAGAAERTLLLHALARPPAGADELLATAVGERDAELFGLRRALFGERLEVVVGCPDCGERLECDLGIGELVGARTDAGPDTGSAPPADPASAGPVRRVESGAWAVQFRLPTTADLAALSGYEDAGEARRALLARIVTRAERSGRRVDADRIPATVQRAIAEAAAEAGPAADITLAMACPGCARQISAELDIGGYLWRELDVWARAVLSDIHVLASCYGWGEREILALSPWRRRYYVEQCCDG